MVSDVQGEETKRFLGGASGGAKAKKQVKFQPPNFAQSEPRLDSDNSER